MASSSSSNRGRISLPSKPLEEGTREEIKAELTPNPDGSGVGVPVEHCVWLPAGAQQVANNPEQAQDLEDGEQDPDVCQSDGHLVEDHAADEGTAQKHHVHGQQP